MTGKDRKTGSAAELRKKAEALAVKNALPKGISGAASTEEIKQTLHELQVHQIELELQNEELRRTQLELDAARARYFDLYDLAPVGYCTISDYGLILEANLTAANLLGVSRGALVKQPVSCFIFRDDQDVYYRIRKQLLETKVPQMCELRMIKIDGTQFWGHLEAVAAQDNNGNPVLRVVLSNITERKHFQGQMRKDLLWSKALAETYDRSVNWNDDELNQFVLDQAVNLTESAIGYFHLISEDQQTIGFSMWNNEALKNCAPGNGGHQSVAKAGNWAECIRTKKPVIFNDYPGSPKQKGLPSGHVKLKRFLSVPVISGDKVMIVFGVGNKEANYDEFDSNHLQLLANDLYKIMVERHIKKVLEGAILFNRQIIHSARDGVVVYDKDLRYQVWNPYMEELTGIPSSRIIGKHPIEVFPFLKENGSLNRLERSLKGDNPSLFEFQFQTARQGISVWVSDKSAPIKDADGKIIGVISIVRDVTEKKLVEDTLRLLNERFDLAARTAMLGIWDWDIPSDTLYWDDRMYDLYGIHKKDFPDAYTAWQKGVHPDDRKRNSEVSQAALRGDCEYEMEFRIIWPDGKIRFIKAFGSVIRDAEGSPLRMTGMNYDITDLVEIQEALRKRDKELENMNRNLENRVQEEVKASMDKDITLVKQGRLAVMGEMIQYITHQWRQPLNNLGLLVQKLKDNNNGDGKRQDEIEIFANKSMDLVQYMSNTIDNFRNFFKKDKQKVSFRLSDITRTAVSIMEASLKNNSIKLEMQVDESVSLTGFPNELSQVILNVLNNSKEAFAVNKTASPKIIIQSTTNNGRTGLIVADNAGGIPESDIGKIFDSDYSTKETGTGIGLYMSKIIIEKNMNGSMSARNIPDGLEVKILF